MKPTTFQTIHIPKIKQRLMQVLLTGKTFVLLTICSMILFVVLGLGSIVQQKVSTSPSATMKGFAAAVSSRFFLDMMGMEMPHLVKDHEESMISERKIGAFLFQMLTNVNPLDPKTLLAREVPGLGHDDAIPLRVGSGNETVSGPEDYHQGTGVTGPESNDHSSDPLVTVELPKTEQAPLVKPTKNGAASTDDSAKVGALRNTRGKKVVFIYHSHNRESWNPELKNGGKDPSSSKVNITLVGKRLATKLEQLGIGAEQSSRDYAATEKNYNWNFSYKYSRSTVKEAIAQNKDLQFFFDIHRDSQSRKKTTVTIDGKTYAQVYFIIGHNNKNWRKNEQFASELHDALEKQYPGISRGIWGKTSANGNGEYNQSLSPNSVVIEIGGVDNTLQESYRTVDVLARLIADVYWKAERVNAAS